MKLCSIIKSCKTYIKIKKLAKVCASLKEGLDFLNKHLDIETCWIIGGSSVYKESMSLSQCNRIYLTHINKEFKCDVFFPPIDDGRFIKLPESISGVPYEIQSEGDLTYTYNVFEKISEPKQS